MDAWARTRLLLGDEAVERLQSCRVAVFGLGGVGGYAVEALARAGIGALDLIDSDRVALSNINRQLLALHSTVGKSKAEAARDRVLDISPDCRVTIHKIFYLPQNRDQFDLTRYDYIVDAIDTVKGKLSLAEQAQEANVPIISAMGAGNKLDPTAFRVADIAETSVCPLARVMRSECKRRGIRRLKVVYSTETPRRPVKAPEDQPGPVRRDIPGSVSYVPGVMGLILAGEVIRDLARIQ